MRRLKDTSYLYATGRVRALEELRLTGDRLERLLKAAGAEETKRVLSECAISAGDAGVAVLSEERGRFYALIDAISPDRRLSAVFRLRYDAHNIKAMIKASSQNAGTDALLIDCGTVPVDKLREAFDSGRFKSLPGRLAQAALSGRELLARTGDAQLLDFEVDRACLEQMLLTAREMNSAFLTGYVRLLIDALNLKAAARAARVESTALLPRALCEGGTVSPRALISALDEKDDLQALFRAGGLSDAAQAFREPARLEQLLGHAVAAYMERARFVPFGEQPVAAYLFAREAELTHIRLILTGLAVGTPPEVIRERLREAYV